MCVLELIWVRPYNLLTPYIQKHLQLPYLLTALQNHLHTSKSCICFCNYKSGNLHSSKIVELYAPYQLLLRTVILKCDLFWGPSIYELNSIKKACKCVPPSKPKPVSIGFICLREGLLWPTSVHSQGPQLFVSKSHCHAPSVRVKKYYCAAPRKKEFRTLNFNHKLE